MKKLWVIFALIVLASPSFGQLTLEQAIKQGLEKNHAIRVSKIDVIKSANNANPGAAGLYPTVAAQGGYSFSQNASNTKFSGGIPDINKPNAQSKNYNGSVQMNYVLFNGLGNLRTYSKLKEQTEAARMQSRITIESTIMQIINAYFGLIRTREQMNISKRTMAISLDRLKRVGGGYEYGAQSKIDMLNARVDYINDSSNYLASELDYRNSMRDLNFLLGNDPTLQLEPQWQPVFDSLNDHDGMKQRVMEYDANLIMSQVNLNIAELDLKINRSTLFPIVSANASYGFSGMENNASFVTSTSTVGLTGGLTLTWNLFDGFKRSKALQNAQLTIESNDIKRQEATNNVSKEYETAYETHQNNLRLLALEELNAEIAALNLKRTEDMYKNGQVTQVEFRQAQLNLYAAETKRNNARFAAKITEYDLIRLQGMLLK